MVNAVGSVGSAVGKGWLLDVDAIVLDEVHYLNDISRGMIWEEIVSSFTCCTAFGTSIASYLYMCEVDLGVHSFLICLGASKFPKICGALSSFLQITMPSAVLQSRGHPYRNTHLKSTKTNIFFLLNTIRVLLHLRLVIASLNQKKLLILCKCQHVLVITNCQSALHKLSNQWSE